MGTGLAIPSMLLRVAQRQKPDPAGNQ